MRRTRFRLAPGIRLAPIALVAGVAMFSASAQAAMAPKECADALVAAMTAAGVTAAYTNATADGDSVVISGVTAKQLNGRELSVGSLTFVNPTPREGGGFTAERMDFTDGSAKERGYTFKAATGSLAATIVPGAEEVKKRTRVTPFAKASIAKITATDADGGDQAPVSIDSVDLELGDMSKGVPHTMKLDVRGIAVDAKRIADLLPTGTADATGEVANLSLNVGIDTLYDSEKDALTIRAISLSAANYGTITMSAGISGIPLSSLASSEKRNDTALSATLDSATLRFENSGIVERLLDEQAKAAGKTRDTYRDELIAQLPQTLNDRLGASDFTTQLAAAAATFLKEPKSIAIESKPAAPVPVFLIGLAIIQIAFGAPVDLSEVKDVQIKTNQ
jgi:hypothetical protein